MELHEELSLSDEMLDISERLGHRLDELRAQGVRQKDIAARAGISEQRLSNYVNRKGNLPDLKTAVSIARAVSVSLDWLTGLNDSEPVDYAPIIVRVLELSGMDRETATNLAEVIREAGRVASALPNEGDAALRSQIAAQTVWLSRGGSKPN